MESIDKSIQVALVSSRFVLMTLLVLIVCVHNLIEKKSISQCFLRPITFMFPPPEESRGELEPLS